ncbi:hypothetical protein SNE40_008828 [Patella caerulea]|uniref:Uncharacterized protein n=1 Tax=Patella caerulea TaxID=87958 RepID=A0AAN8JQV7_PATCE
MLAVDHLNAQPLLSQYLGQTRLPQLLDVVSDVMCSVENIINDVCRVDDQYMVDIQQYRVEFNVLNIKTVKKIKVIVTFDPVNILKPKIDLKPMIGDIKVEGLQGKLDECDGRGCIKQILKLIQDFIAI